MTRIPVHEALAGLHDYDTVIDVRSPSEWSLDHLPGAINAPALSDAERTTIGTLYATSAFEAKKRGAALVARNIARALDEQFIDRPRDWRPLVYCWRGGNRSLAMATVMERIGWKVHVLDGGYAAYRKFVIADLALHVARLRYVVVCGVTGSGKTAYLRQLRDQGKQVLDLEGLAHHRGSLLGNEPTGQQPSQKQFESRIWDNLRQYSEDRPVFVESESKKIGAVQVPDPLIARMRESPCIELSPPLDERVAFLCQDYAHFFEQPDVLRAQLERLKPLVGEKRLSAWMQLIDAQRWPELVASLLADHYDPTYAASMRRNYRDYAHATRREGHPGLAAPSKA